MTVRKRRINNTVLFLPTWRKSFFRDLFKIISTCMRLNLRRELFNSLKHFISCHWSTLVFILLPNTLSAIPNSSVINQHILKMDFVIKVNKQIFSGRRRPRPRISLIRHSHPEIKTRSLRTESRNLKILYEHGFR